LGEPQGKVAVWQAAGAARPMGWRASLLGRGRESRAMCSGAVLCRWAGVACEGVWEVGVQARGRWKEFVEAAASLSFKIRRGPAPPAPPAPPPRRMPWPQRANHPQPPPLLRVHAAAEHSQPPHCIASIALELPGCACAAPFDREHSQPQRRSPALRLCSLQPGRLAVSPSGRLAAVHAGLFPQT
jgi:hypothetical protein